MDGKTEMKIIRVQVNQAEGVTGQLVVSDSHGEDSEALGDQALRRIARWGPDLGYYKTDVTVTFEDRTKVRSRHDVKQGDTDGTVRSHALWVMRMTGRVTP